MTARTTMTGLINVLRGMTNAGATDYSVNSVSFWSDDQLQTILDRYATIIRDEALTAMQTFTAGGAVLVTDYQSSNKFFETTSGGTLRFVVKDYTGGTAGTALWSADYERGLVTFVANTSGSAYYLTGYSYDVYAAAADVWYQKAAHASEQIDFSADNHNIKRSHIAAAAYKMAQRYEGLSSSNTSVSVEIDRGDMNIERGYIHA